MINKILLIKFLRKLASFCSQKKTAQWRIYVKSFEDLYYLKIYRTCILMLFSVQYTYP